MSAHEVITGAAGLEDEASTLRRIRLGAFARILRHGLPRTGGESSWGLREMVKHMASRDAQRRRFARHVVNDLNRYLTNDPVPIAGETLPRAQLAANWLARAQDVMPDGGVSYGYFPFRTARGWRESYPETTGYIAPTLFDYADVCGETDYHDRAVRAARFVTGCQMASGAIYGGRVRASVRGAIPVAFNTGMALLGFSAAYRRTGDPLFRESARKAAEFLVNDVDPDGHFRSHGPFVHSSTIKTYTVLCAWPLYLAGEDCEEPGYCRTAVRVCDAALRQQRENGWFENNCLSAKDHAPLLHTIGYTLQGLLEVGILSGERRLVAATERAFEHLSPLCSRGFLHGRWFWNWEPAALSSCLTGAAQVAVVGYRLAAHTGNPRYRRAADAALNYLKALQPTGDGHVADPEIVGAIGGSFPLVGAYMRNGYPSWASKFFLDALLQQDLHRRGCQEAQAAPVQRSAEAHSGLSPTRVT
jgi:hypothetical protein